MSKQHERDIQKMDLEAWDGGPCTGKKRLYKDCWVVGGEEGVMATCRESRPSYSDLIYVLNGDDGNWWVAECFDEAWLSARIAVLRRVQDGLGKT
jgi:hypothetical protein